jgi:peptidoglycan/LPS O-acetylase OafA/YrhL
VTHFGRYGVDLFFVLSGWLIGGLYWREAATFGNVELPTFLVRRWLRTIPPYLVGLGLAWMAVRLVRGEPFDKGYLFFVQNYYDSIPFFLVSWSLCIEEHFYLFLPLALALLPKSRLLFASFVPALVISAPVSRFIVSADGVDSGFGYVHTATHLRMEGLILGFFAAILPYHTVIWSKTRRLTIALIVPAIVVMISLAIWPALWMYRIGYTVLAATLLIVVVYFAQRRDFWIARTCAIKWLALTSYSVYLTHALMIHVSRLMMQQLPMFPVATYYLIAGITIATGGVLFYFAVERTSIQMRDRLAPRRTSYSFNKYNLRRTDR